MLRPRHILLTALLLPLLSAAQPATAVKRTDSFIALLLKVKSDDGKLTAKDKEANQKIFAELDGYFDWDRLLNDPIAPRVDKFSAAEKADYLKKFKEVIRLVAYPDSGGFFRKATYTLSPPKEQGDLVTVTIDAKVVKDDLQTKVDLNFKKIGDAYRIWDVAFDGDSLVRDYTNQFVRIIDKEGAKGLIAKIDKRKAELETPAKPK